MKKLLKWIGIILGSLLGIIVLAAAGLLIYGQLRWKPTLDRPLREITADTSPEGIARGEYLVKSVMACTDCHTAKPDGGWLAGQVTEINAGPIQAVFAAPNLTPDKETGLGNWTDAQIARAIREGVDKDGVGLVVMPSFNFHRLADADVAAIIGYLRSIEPVNNPIPPFTASPVAKVMAALGVLGPSPIGEPITTVQVAPSPDDPAYGDYMMTIAGCRDCHGFDYTGGPVPMTGPEVPPAPNLTRTGELIGWSEADFINTLRTGVTPSGHQLHEVMPWKIYGTMTDSDLAAIFRQLQSQPAPVANK
jgi:mono/diheme cytochrome c family protein